MKRWKNICLENYKPYSLENSQYASKKQKKKARAFYKKYGFRYEETWNLDHTIACFVLPRLAYFREHMHGTPNDFIDFDENMQIIGEHSDEWAATIDKMINSFELIASEKDIGHDKEIQEGLELFGKYFRSLWD